MTMKDAIIKIRELNNVHADKILCKMQFDLTQERFEQYCENCGLEINEENLIVYLNVLLSIYEYSLRLRKKGVSMWHVSKNKHTTKDLYKVS